MIQIPPQVILGSLQEWCTLHFKDVKHSPAAPPHWYFTIPVDPGTLFVICIATSQVEKRGYYYQETNPKAAQSLVRLEANCFPFLPKETLIDCNKAEMLSVEELRRRINPDVGLSIQNPEISKNLKKRIIAAIDNSPLIPNKIKKALEF